MSDTKYLYQRGLTWYVQVRIPQSLQPILDQQKITVSLKTRDLQEAKDRKHAVVGTIKTMFSRLAKESLSHQTASSIINEFKQFKQEVELGLHGENKEELLRQAVEDIHMRAEDHISPSGMDATGVDIDPETGHRADIDEALLDDYRLAETLLTSDAEQLLVSVALDAHLDELARHAIKQTVRARRRRVTEFLTWLGSDRLVSKITRRDASRYLTNKLMKLDRSVKTKKDIVGDIAAFFQWCVDRTYCDLNVFAGLSKSIKETTRGTKTKTEAKKRPFKPDELTKLFEAIKLHRKIEDPLWSLSVIALYSGMRANEIAETRIENVNQDFIHIPEGKTDAARRDVPIHPVIKPLVKQLIEKNTDSYLISGLKRGGEDSKRYHSQGKRFSTILRGKAGIEYKSVTFHSFRHNFITACRDANIQRPIIQQIVGHSDGRGDVTDVYLHGGYKLPELIEAIERVSYGEEIDSMFTLTTA